MPMRSVFSVRVNKGDAALKKYLEQFNESEQNQALKNLCIYGAERLEKNFEQDSTLKSIESSLSSIEKEQSNKFDRIIELMEKGEPLKTKSTVSADEDEMDVDAGNMKDSLLETFSQFEGL